MGDPDILRYSYPTLLKRSKNLSYRKQVEETTLALLNFLLENELLLANPFNEDGSIKSDLVVRRSDLTETGDLLMKTYFPKWSAYIDRGGEVTRVNILSNGLKKLRESAAVE
ncbi:hypothetical protein [Saccharibacillus alkalitolerans]|uniref:Uncharacterized protein n=1 Tax=Saccharibacillus alkalitolerans TaxID=2705290 RepID=A0ABX0F6E5_9BACL|nr:hypothetical protein [Saccharibacillus alkalitolerans]NGZ75913.1 hypothetical protein [Saccharibacillus alkalitolerans]